MPRVPAHCPKCGSIFPAPVEIGEGAFMSFSNVGMTCPVCGNPNAVVSEGLYTTANNAVRMLSGPDFSRQTLKIFQEITKQFTDGSISKDEAQRQARSISPQLESLFNKFSTFGMPALMLLIALISLYLQYEGNNSSSEDSKRLLDAVLSHPYSVQELQDKNRIDQKAQSPPESKTVNEPSPVNGATKLQPSNRQKVRIARLPP
jgi:hypothetical protein